MKFGDPSCSSLVLAVLFLSSIPNLSQAAIVNGDFQTGDLTGWTASGVDGLGGAATPLVSVGSVGGNPLAIFDTGEFATGPFISTLEQTFVVDPANPFLSFHFSGLFTAVDASGTGASPFLDAFAVSLESGGSFYDLLLLDQFGASADPFGTAPGTVALGVPLTSNLDMTFSADLTSLAGQSVTLFADMINEDDGFQSSVWFDNAILQDELDKKTIIPEPASLAIWSVFLLGGTAAVRRWQRKRKAA